MKFLGSRSLNDSQWNVYRQLELIPESIPNPADHPRFISAINLLWRPLLALLVDELVEEQRVEYLDRCWLLDEFGEREPSPSSSLQRLWTLMS